MAEEVVAASFADQKSVRHQRPADGRQAAHPRYVPWQDPFIEDEDQQDDPGRQKQHQSYHAEGTGGQPRDGGGQRGYTLAWADFVVQRRAAFRLLDPQRDARPGVDRGRMLPEVEALRRFAPDESVGTE